MNNEFEKALKQLINAFSSLKKLDPQDYYASWMDRLFQEYVMKLASKAQVEDPNLITAIKYAQQNYWNPEADVQGGENATPVLSLNEEDSGQFNA